MTWRVVSASVTGTGHVRDGDQCQDAFRVVHGEAPSGRPYVIVVVSDGAGSAKLGGRGAALAVEASCDALRERIAVHEPASLDDQVIREVAVAVRARLSREAIAESLDVRDLACTLLGAVVADDFAAFFQVGDGAIITTGEPTYAVVFWPDAGPFANMTYFITDDDALEHLRICLRQQAPDEFALFSDGMQRLALVFEGQRVHSPFFLPMFERLRCARADQCEELCEHLERFLDSPQVNQRTDDDKTLVLATRLPPDTTGNHDAACV